MKIIAMRKLIWKGLLILCAFFTLSACDDNEVVVDTFCGDAIRIDATLYGATTISNYSITDVVILDDCITITIGSSGCDPNSWIASLIDSEQEALSLPPQRNIRLSLENNDACLAFFQTSYTFDLRPLLNNTNEPLILNLDGWNEQIIINESS